MSISHRIHCARIARALSTEALSRRTGISGDRLEAWEQGREEPDAVQLQTLAQGLGVTAASLLEQEYRAGIHPHVEKLHCWEDYSANLNTEYTQSLEEGLDLSAYQDLFRAVEALPRGTIRHRLGQVISQVVQTAPHQKDYPYLEPSELSSIRALRLPHPLKAEESALSMEERLLGAWTGRICGCLLGKTVEGIRSGELTAFLKETDNFPMHRYILSTDLNEERCGRYQFPFSTRCYADTAGFMPYDDDTNYLVLAQEIIRKYGRDFTPGDVAQAWMDYQPKESYCTAERVAYCNFLRGYEPPASAVYQNPFREWIGAQIRGDYFGYINPGDPESAAEMAWRDASISHVKNGIYGEMFAAAMIACAAVTADLREIVLGGLAQIPSTSRLYAAVQEIVTGYDRGGTWEEAVALVHEHYDENTAHGWCHTISNAMLVTAALLYGGGDYGKTICLAVQPAYDTDCNGATVGSIVGMLRGFEGLGKEWTEPIHDTLETTLFGMNQVSIRERAAMTMEHLGI